MLLVRDIMCSKPEYLSPQATLQEAAFQMRSQNYGFVPIGDNDRLVGAVTDRDITIRAVAEGKDPGKTKLDKIMSKGIHYCLETEKIEDAMKKMDELHVHRLVVLNDNKRLTGILSLGDIAAKCDNDPKILSALTKAVSHHHQHHHH